MHVMIMASNEAIVACGLPSDFVSNVISAFFLLLAGELLLIPEQRGNILPFAAALEAFLSQKQNRVPKDAGDLTHTHTQVAAAFMNQNVFSGAQNQISKVVKRFEVGSYR